MQSVSDSNNKALTGLEILLAAVTFLQHTTVNKANVQIPAVENNMRISIAT